MTDLNATHDTARRSFVPGASRADTDFPLQNLPFGIVDGGCAVAIGTMTLPLRPVQEAGLIDEPAVLAPSLNALMDAGPARHAALRARLFALLAEGTAEQGVVGPLLRPAAAPALPVAINAFTDFFTSVHHTERGGKLAGRNPPVPPAFRSLPIAYNSRASSVRVSGEGVRRPNGQRRGDRGGSAVFGPSVALDFELELGAFVAGGNPLGEPLHIDRAAECLWGFCLVNDWSSRDVQGWESDPLGPFLCKSFSTTVSPWVVTEEALRPFRVPAAARPTADGAALPYLVSERDQERGGIALRMEAFLRTPAMSAGGQDPAPIVRADFRDMYWTFAQMAVHHMSNGCNLRTGDLLGSGTVSGPSDESRACLAELTARGQEPLTLPNGERRSWLEDGDEVVFRARAERDGFVSIGFGECRGTVLPAPAWPHQ